MIDVQDNFLDKINSLVISKSIYETSFPWYYNEGKSFKGDGFFQLTHTLMYDGKVNSDYFKIFEPIFIKLNAKILHKCKLNLTTKQKKITNFDFHTDVDIKNSKTAVYYINSNNGYTIFENKKKVYSKENRIVIFNSSLKHAGSTHTDENIRLVLNINYEN
jgi:hypothetical protein